MSRFDSLADLQRWCMDAPEGTRLSARQLAAELDRLAGEPEPETPAETPVEPAETTWRTKLWTCPAETRLGLQELREALDVSESWVYSRTKQDADPRLPHGKFGGSLVFKAGEVRAWLRDHEDVEVAYRMDSAPGELRVQQGGAA